MSILFAILLFSLLIFVHELGHFVAAKLSGVQVNEFAMFMGPAIFKKQVGETLYSLRCIPFGGYCAMEGEDGESENPRAFGAAAWWKRLIILVAGAFMNLVTGVLLLAIIFAPMAEISQPIFTSATDYCTIIREDGLHIGDRVVELDGEAVYSNSDFTMLLALADSDRMDIVVERDGKLLTFNDFAMETHLVKNDAGQEVRLLGIKIGKGVPATASVKLQTIWNTAKSYVRSVRLSLQMLFSGQAGFQDLGGPVMIVQQISQTADASDSVISAVLNVLNYGALLAINLAVMNLLPIPALDGGRAVCLLLTTAAEAITGKKINAKYEAYLHGAGMILLLGLMAAITFKDIFVIFKR